MKDYHEGHEEHEGKKQELSSTQSAFAGFASGHSSLIEFHLRDLRGFSLVFQLPAAALFNMKDDYEGSKNETLDPILKSRVVEVDQQTNFHARKLHVGQQLGLMDALNFLNTFEFENKLTFDKNAIRYPQSRRTSLYCTGNGCWSLKAIPLRLSS